LLVSVDGLGRTAWIWSAINNVSILASDKR